MTERTTDEIFAELEALQPLVEAETREFVMSGGLHRRSKPLSVTTYRDSRGAEHRCNGCDGTRHDDAGNPYPLVGWYVGLWGTQRSGSWWEGYCQLCAKDQRNRHRRETRRHFRKCAVCLKPFRARADGIYHSAACRQKAYRQRLAGAKP